MMHFPCVAVCRARGSRDAVNRRDRPFSRHVSDRAGLTSPTLSTMFKYRGNDWPDMSEYVVHLTKGPDPRTAFYSILTSGVIRVGTASGLARDVPAMGQVAACFSDVPVYEVDRLASRYSAYGIGFHHETLVRQGGARVW